MVKFRTFKGALGKIENINIQKVPETEKLIAKRAIFDKNTKQYKFFDKKGNEIVRFHQYDVKLISRIVSDDDKFEFLICLNDDLDYKMEFNMQDGYSFFVTDGYEKSNIEEVIKAAPKHLCSLKDKCVVVRKSINHEAVSFWNADSDSEDFLVMEKFTINDFDYGVRKKSGLATIDLFDKSDTNNKATAFDVTFVVSDTDNEGSVIIGTTMGEFSLSPVV